MFFAVKVLQIRTITLIFLEKGHTQMKCDSMHSAIESERKHKKVFDMEKWQKIMKDAKCFDKNGTLHSHDVHLLKYQGR